MKRRQTALTSAASFVLGVGLTAVTAFGGGALAQDLESAGAVFIEEWRVPYEESRPRDPFAVGDDVWFVGQRTGYLARLTPETGAFEKIDLPDGEGPHNLIVGEDGVVWYAGNRRGVIGRYDPRSGVLEEIAMPDPAARDPHTLIFDADGAHIWFTVQGGDFIGRMTIESRAVELIPSRTARSRPYGIKQAPDGTIWVALFGINKLARIDPATLALEEVTLPRSEARPRRLEVGADGRVWYVDYAGGKLGAYDPGAGAFREWDMPSGPDARPYGTAMDGDGNVWFVETGVQPNLFTGFDPETERFFGGTPAPSGGGVIRHMYYDSRTDSVWFGSDTNYIGRARVGDRVKERS